MQRVRVSLLWRQESRGQLRLSLTYFSNHFSSGQALAGSPGLSARPKPPPYVFLGTLEVGAQWPVFRKGLWFLIVSWAMSSRVGLRGYWGSTTGAHGWDEAVPLNFGRVLTSLPPRIQI